MTLRLAFAGFRHGHIFDLYRQAEQCGDVSIAAACEPDAAAADLVAAAGKVRLTHRSYDELFASADDFDAVAVGDYYAARGGVVLRALRAGKHVISDKPICTDLAELGQIEAEARERGLAVGCQLDLRGSGNFIALRELIAAGRLGEVVTVSFTGQHPLVRDTRPAWYFEPGCHGGTLNDLAVHGADLAEWLSGRRIVRVVAARAWNGGLCEPGWFQVGGQLMLCLDNDGGVLGDVSYLAPTRGGYATANYWRFLVHGRGGQAETSIKADGVTVIGHDGRAERIPPAADRADAALADFIDEAAGRSGPGALTTAAVLRATRLALLAQQAADRGQAELPCG